MVFIDYRKTSRRGSDMTQATNPLDTQVAGNHYKNMKIQPFEFSMANNFNAGQHSILKYVSRYKNKNHFEDLKKAHHFLEMLMSHEYPKDFSLWKIQPFMPEGKSIIAKDDLHPKIRRIANLMQNLYGMEHEDFSDKAMDRFIKELQEGIDEIKLPAPEEKLEDPEGYYQIKEQP